MDETDRDAQARALLDAWATGGQVQSDPAIPADADEGYRIAAKIAEMRIARGETLVGRKIGFTNRTIWPIYKVDAPMWGWMYDTTLHMIDTTTTIPVPNFSLPRLEPEIAFGFAATPSPGMSTKEIDDCIDWVAHGIEIVTSPYPRWRFTFAQTVAAQGLHGAYHCGPKVPMAQIGHDALEDFTLILTDGIERHSGHARAVLGGPLHAIRFLLDEIGRMPGAPPIAPGEIVTTGTLTDALEIAPGQSWTTRLDGITLPGLDVSFA